MASTSTEADGSLRLFKGSCHCGRVTYTIKIDLAHPAAVRCNCSICLKRGYLSYKPTARNEFTLLTPSGFEELRDYTFASHNTHHYFCAECGVACFVRGDEGGIDPEKIGLNLLTIDAGQGLDLTKFKINYWNGKEDWEGGPRDTPWPGGQV